MSEASVPSTSVSTGNQESPILRLVAGGIQVPGTERFVCDEAALREAHLRCVDDNFTSYFFEKVEEGVSDADLAVHRLERDALDTTIFQKLGPITLCHLLNLLKKQSRQQNGHLWADGRVNIARIEDKNGALWVVSVGWVSRYHCWEVNVYPLSNPRTWYTGCRVVSHER